MINLLPPEMKESYFYAHRNVRLVRWVVAFAVSFVGLITITTGGMIYLHQLGQTYLTQISEQQASLKKQDQAATQAQVKDITNSLKLAVSVLSKEVLFSKLLTQLATVTPSSVELSGLSITQVTGGVDVTALAKDYQSATQLQVNLTDPANKIFIKADIISITCGTSPDVNYPCTVTIRALFAKNNPFLFINAGGRK